MNEGPKMLLYPVLLQIDRYNYHLRREEASY